MKKLPTYLLILVLTIVLSGCSITPNGMRQHAPDVVHTSQKNAHEITICIAEKWENHGVVNQRETQSGYSLTASISGKLHYLADIENRESGSKTKVYKFMSTALGSDPYFDSVAICQ